MKIKIAAVVVLACAPVFCEANTVTITDQKTPLIPKTYLPITDSLGASLLDANSRILVGSFNLGAMSSTDFFAQDIGDIYAGFTEFNPGSVATFNTAGHFVYTQGAVIEGTSLANQKIYLWAFKTTGGSDLGVGLGNVLEHGIFSSSSTTTGSVWNFMNSEAEPLPTFRTQQIDQYFVSTGSSLKLAALTPIPEASSAMLMLGGLGLLAMGNRRRSRK